MSVTQDIHGLAKWKATRGLSDTPLNGEPFAKGDKVTFTNDYGVKFPGLTVIGFSNEIYDNSGTIYLNYDCYWYPTKPETLTKEA